MRFFMIMTVLSVCVCSGLLFPVTRVEAAKNTPKCTIKGTFRSEVLRGTPRNDVICGFGGNDTIMGMGGKDIIMGGAGNDIIDGGVGNDLLLGEDGNDTLIGGVDNDALIGGIGRDRLTGGTGKNHCVIDGIDGVVGTCPIDQIAPQLSLIEWPQIPVMAGNTLRFTWNASDSSGVVSTTAEIVGANGQQADWCAPLPDNRVSGDEFTGTYAVNCVIPTTVIPQRYAVTLSAEDYFGNRSVALIGSFLVTNDQIAPQLSLIEWPQIPVVAGNTLRFTWNASDLSGVVSTTAEIVGANGQRADWCAPLPDNRVSGDEFTGTYAVNCVVPTTVTPQRYAVTLSADDYFGNRITELFGSFLVANRAVDTKAPQFGIVAIPEMEVTAGTTLTLNWDATDESGVSSTYVKFAGPSGWISNWCGFGTMGDRVSGDEFAGTYRVSCAIPANAVSQRYDVYIGAQDYLGNSDEARQISFRVVNGATDTAAPVIADLRATDTNRGAQAVIRWRAQDETAVGGMIAWVAYGDYNFADNTGRGYVRYDTGAILVSGTPQDGLYEQKVTVRADAPAGRYTLWMRAGDTLGNSTLTQTKVEFMVR